MDIEKGEIEGTVSTIMLMGHYVLLMVQVGSEIVKCYVNREMGDQQKEGNKVKLTISKSAQFPLRA